MSDKKTIGQRFVSQFPLASRYPDDPDMASKKEKEVARTIDFFASFVPKTKKELAVEAAITLIPFGQVAKAGIKGTSKIAREVFPQVKKEVLEYMSDPRYRELMAGYETPKSENATKVWEDGVGWVNATLKKGSGVTTSQKKRATERVDRYKKRLEDADIDFESDLPSTTDPTVQAMGQTRYDKNKAVMNRKFLGGKYGHLNTESIKHVLREELIHLATQGNKDMPSKLKEAITLRQLQPGRDRMPKHMRLYIDPSDRKKGKITSEGNMTGERFWRDDAGMNQTAIVDVDQKNIDYYYKPTETYAKLLKSKIRAGLKPGEKVGDVYPDKMASSDFEALKALYPGPALRNSLPILGSMPIPSAISSMLVPGID